MKIYRVEQLDGESIYRQILNDTCDYKKNHLEPPNAIELTSSEYEALKSYLESTNYKYKLEKRINGLTIIIKENNND